MMSSYSSPDHSLLDKEDTRLARFLARFREGPLVVLLMLAYVGVAAFSVQLGGWQNQYVPVGVTGLAGAVAGMLLAKTRLSDATAQFASVAMGMLLSGVLLLMNAEMFGERFIDRPRPFLTFVVDWYLGRQETADDEYLLVSFLLGLLVWMFAFLATWSLFRRGWVAAGLLLPAALALITLRYAPESSTWVPGAMLFLAVPIAARMFALQREQRWARRNIASPIGLGGKFLVAGTVVGMLVTLASAQTPESWSRMTFDPLMQELGKTYTRATDRASGWFDVATGEEDRNLQNAGSYTAFDDAFSVGGPLELSTQPEVLVQTSTSQAPYLTAHSYDLYTGRGWASTTDEAFGEVETDQGRLAPELLFREGQEVVLTDNVTQSRVAQSSTITPLGGPSGVVFSVDTYLTSDIQTVVRMSWQRLDDTAFPVSTDALNSLPPDIQKIGNLLLQAELSGSDSDWGPEATSAAMQQEIEDEVDALAGRGILIRWDTVDGIVANVYITGRIPVFDDVEAVYPRDIEDAASGSSYQVQSLTSAASPDQLVAASTTYPAWVAERYLATGDTLTDRTRQLAIEVVGDAADPYTQAVRIEAFLRDHIAYNEQVSEPPADADLVDYVLFEDQQGYCEHYSASMTVMMRSLGVPARTVVGYYPGEWDESMGGYVYRQLNAHAWTEVFFPGYGWIPFEPTANRPLDDRDATVVPEETAAPEPTEMIPTPDVADENTASTPVPENRTIENPGPPEPIVVDDNGGGGGIPGWVVPVGGALATIGTVVIGVWLAWSWRFRGLSPIEALFAKTQRVGSLGGVRNGPTTTPREYANRFSEQMPAMGPPVRRIVQVYESDQYGPAGADAGSLAVAREAWRELRRAAVRMVVRVRRKRGR